MTPLMKGWEDTSRNGIGDSLSSNRRMSPADGDRVDQKVQLVEKTGGQHLTNDGDGSVHRDILPARLLLQAGDGRDEAALQLLGVAPGELEVLVRDDDLARIAQRLGKTGVLAAGGLAVRPGGPPTPAKLS